jgi:hypothetical protein
VLTHVLRHNTWANLTLLDFCREVDPAILAQDVREAEEDVADAKDPTIRAAAELKLFQLKEVQTAIAAGR